VELIADVEERREDKQQAELDKALADDVLLEFRQHARAAARLLWLHGMLDPSDLAAVGEEAARDIEAEMRARRQRAAE